MSEEKDGSGEQGRKEGSGQISRRDFLKDAGLVVSTPAIGSMQRPRRLRPGAQSGRGREKWPGSPSAAKCAGPPHSIELTVNGENIICGRTALEPSATPARRDSFTSPKDWCGGTRRMRIVHCDYERQAGPVLPHLACECDGAQSRNGRRQLLKPNTRSSRPISITTPSSRLLHTGFVCTAKRAGQKPNPTEADVRDARAEICAGVRPIASSSAVLEAARNLKQQA